MEFNPGNSLELNDDSLELNGFRLVEERREDIPGFGSCRTEQERA